MKLHSYLHVAFIYVQQIRYFPFFLTVDCANGDESDVCHKYSCAVAFDVFCIL